MATSVSRETVRKAFAALLGTALVGSGKPAAAVYDYQVGDFQGQSPVVVVSSGGGERTLSGMASCWRTTVYLNVHVFVLYADPASGWTEADAEDAIDEIEATIADVILANLSNGTWSEVTYREPTLPDGVAIGGDEYRRETIQLTFEVVN